MVVAAAAWRAPSGLLWPKTLRTAVLGIATNLALLPAAWSTYVHLAPYPSTLAVDPVLSPYATVLGDRRAALVLPLLLLLHVGAPKVFAEATVAERLLDLGPGPGLALVPERVAVALNGFRRPPPLIAVRQLYLEKLRGPIPEADRAERLALLPPSTAGPAPSVHRVSCMPSAAAASPPSPSVSAIVTPRLSSPACAREASRFRPSTATTWHCRGVNLRWYHLW